MRAVAWTMMLLCAACDGPQSSQPTPVAAEPPVTFDGAGQTSAGAIVQHGDRLTRVLGCRGCHSKQLEGKLWDNDPSGLGVFWASNLTRSVPAMTDAQLVALLKAGVHPTGRDVWIMPSELFQHTSEPDLKALIAYLRTVPATGEASPDPVLGPTAIAQIKSGEVKPAAALVREHRDTGPVDLGPSHGLGRYISRLTCAECHGPELKGGQTPDLIVAGGYSREEFERLMTQGVPTGNRKLHPLMQSVAQSRYSHLTVHERDALYAYLKARAEQPAD